MKTLHEESDNELLDVYNSLTQEEHNEFEAMYELLTMDINIDIQETKRALSYFILKTYLLENKLID